MAFWPSAKFTRTTLGFRSATVGWPRGGGYRADAAGPEVGAETAEDAGVSLAAALPEPVAVIAAPTDADDPAAEELTEADNRAAGDETGADEWNAEEVGGEEPAASSEGGFDRAWRAAPGTAVESTADESAAAAGAAAGVADDAASRAEAAPADLPWEDVLPFVPGAADHGAAPPISKPIAAEPAEMTGEPISYATLRAGEPGAEVRTDAAADWAAASDDIVAESAEPVFPAGVRARLEGENGEPEIIETLGGDEFEEAEHQRSRARRHYKIQEVVKRRQIMLVQVTKEERGNKGAALTTYLSLAGRYCVLMPNTARGGGVSRKITSISDRRRLKDILERARHARRHGRDRAHRRRRALEGRDQARLRIPAAAVERDPRADAEVDRAGPDL